MYKNTRLLKGRKSGNPFRLGGNPWKPIGNPFGNPGNPVGNPSTNPVGGHSNTCHHAAQREHSFLRQQKTESKRQNMRPWQLIRTWSKRDLTLVLQNRGGASRTIYGTTQNRNREQTAVCQDLPVVGHPHTCYHAAQREHSLLR